MSIIQVTLERITKLSEHPNADKLEIAQILGTQTIVPKDQFVAGEQVLFFPPDLLLPPKLSEVLGIQQYLKPSLWDEVKCNCRVGACRLRGIPSYGFIIKRPKDLPLHKLNDYTEYFGAIKYEPPLEFRFHGDAVREPNNFPRYTDIQHYYRYPEVIKPGTMVRVTEKIHGTSSRLGNLKINGENTIVCGSHRTAKKEYNITNKRSLYWEPFLSNLNIQRALKELGDKDDIIIYGEIFGCKIQDMDYGIQPGKIGFRVFDISINGCYLDWADLQALSTKYQLELVPLLYCGPFDPTLLEDWTNGPTTFKGMKSKFKGREGCVITPLTEMYDETLGRVILKSVSADYLARKGAKDNA